MFEDSWEVEIDTVSDCSKAPKEVIVWVEPTAKVKIDTMMEEYPTLEWLAYLLGKDNVVKDIHIPNQMVSSVNVWDVKCLEYNSLPVIGVIHSHHGMGNGFSGTDHEWINQNHNISLCIAKQGINGQVRWKTPCGSLKIVKAVTKLKLDLSFKKDDFLKKVEEKVEKEIKVVNTYSVFPKYGDNKKRFFMPEIDNQDNWEKLLEDDDSDDEETLADELSKIENQE